MAQHARNRPVTTIARTEGAPLFEDQVREYRQNQRRRYNTQREIQRVARRITGGVYNNSLEQQLDPQTQLRLSMQERASIVPAEVLYHSRRDDVHHRIYVHRSEEAMLVTSNQIDRAFIQPESFTQLQRSGMRFLHMGIIQVRIQILHRQEEGTLALIVFRDNRWQGDQAIFATMEIDLTHGSQLVYVIPDTMLTISDFYRNIQVSILTRGYENWRNGEANLLVTRGLVGRLSNTPNVGFAYEVQNVVDYLASHGVRALPGRSYNTRDVLGHNWIIRQSTVNIPMQPTEVNTRNMLDGSVSLQFDNYQAAASSAPPRFNSKDEEVQSDEEEIQGHIIVVLVEERRPEELLVKRISSLAQLPVRRTSGAAGYDISITHAQDIPAHDRSLLSTGICIQIPQNTYARIAPRSSAALRGIIIMGGVIDSDYRGEVKIMAFNMTNDDIFLNKQECIAQLIIEHIATPNVREVEELHTTPRGISGFGSTTIRPGCSHTKADPACTGCHYYCSDEDYAADYDEYVAARPTPEQTVAQKQKGKEIMAIKHLPDEQLLAMQKKARQYAIEQHKFYEEENGLILSPTKMKIGSPTIEFLGATIGHSNIKLQTHIISKIADFSNQELQTTKGLRSWLGILNYARSYIPNLGKILGPLYSKTSPNGEKKMNAQDWALVEKVKVMVKTLPDLAIPPAHCFVIIESDGCMEGWGGASYSSPPTPCGPYPLLDQYQELAEGIGASTNTPYEKDKRQHMEDIESTAARNLLNSLWKLKLILNAKEKDFARRCQVKRGLYLYFQDALPEVMQTKGALLDTFIRVQGIVQKIKETPPLSKLFEKKTFSAKPFWYLPPSGHLSRAPPQRRPSPYFRRWKNMTSSGVGRRRETKKRQAEQKLARGPCTIQKAISAPTANPNARPSRRRFRWNTMQKRIRKAIAQGAMQIGDGVVGPSGDGSVLSRVQEVGPLIWYQSLKGVLLRLVCSVHRHNTISNQESLVGMEGSYFYCSDGEEQHNFYDYTGDSYGPTNVEVWNDPDYDEGEGVYYGANPYDDSSRQPCWGWTSEASTTFDEGQSQPVYSCQNASSYGSGGTSPKPIPRKGVPRPTGKRTMTPAQRLAAHQVILVLVPLTKLTHAGTPYMQHQHPHGKLRHRKSQNLHGRQPQPAPVRQPQRLQHAYTVTRLPSATTAFWSSFTSATATTAESVFQALEEHDELRRRATPGDIEEAGRAETGPRALYYSESHLDSCCKSNRSPEIKTDPEQAYKGEAK
ncbi:hypothetical protein ZIOFF_069633 [Zingiber officinale]|uniref:dUTP diphosphatase n=1 Tax=Zingiber officinale TaxID=94328 RepID=A0A8J5EU86_ZINOF|nr:hypothetical protein ZIOFF_069633 [Zingiber officinale]